MSSPDVVSLVQPKVYNIINLWSGSHSTVTKGYVKAVSSAKLVHVSTWFISTTILVMILTS